MEIGSSLCYRDHSKHIEIPNICCLGIACTWSFDMGWASAEDKILECFKLTTNDFLISIMKLKSNHYVAKLSHILYHPGAFYVYAMTSMTYLLVSMEQHTLKIVNNCLNTNIYSYIETSGGQNYNLYLNVVHFLTPILIKHLWQLMTVVFLQWCLKCAVPLLITIAMLRSEWPED